MSALHTIATVLDLDYAGVDFAVAADGRLLLFEANAAMIIAPPTLDPIWEYRRPAVRRATEAVQVMIRDRASDTGPRR